MPLPQDISPINSQIADSLVRASQMEWIPNSSEVPPRTFIKVLWTAAESGTWVILARGLKGASVPPHKHLSGAHTFVLSGSIKVRDMIANAGDYLYEANGMVHESTTYLEDSEVLFICHGAQLFYDENGFTAYNGWEQMRRVQEAQNEPKKKVA
jgi:anti-sigma factor ChrR (cupin superfamily)